jgi:hypothetical protein
VVVVVVVVVVVACLWLFQVYRCRRSQAVEDATRALRDEAAQCMAKWKAEAARRREIHNQLVDLLGNIRVFVRVRPVLQHEIDSAEAADVTMYPSEDVIAVSSVRGQREASGSFEFDRVLRMSSSQVSRRLSMAV